MDKSGFHDLPIGGIYSGSEHVLALLAAAGIDGRSRAHVCGAIVRDTRPDRMKHLKACGVLLGGQLEGKEVDPMAKTKISSKEAAARVLRSHGGPMHVKEITERILSRYETGLKGATPQATISAQLGTMAKKKEIFKKTDAGTFDLIDRSGSAPAATAKTPAKKRAASKRSTAKRAASKRSTAKRATAKTGTAKSPAAARATAERKDLGGPARPDPRPEGKKSGRSRGAVPAAA